VEEQMITANPDITKLRNENLDFIIMGCDGIWEVKTNAEMVNYMRRKMDDKKPLNKIVEELLDELISKDSSSSEYGMDNMSAILIKFKK
jgi:serine/threonine protein phosphatase PrpC